MEIFMKLLKLLALATLFFTVSCAHHHKHGHGHDHHQKFEKMDTNGDKSVSMEEYQSYKETKFKKKDANNDGKISHEEWHAGHGHGNCEKKKSCCGSKKCDMKKTSCSGKKKCDMKKTSCAGKKKCDMKKCNKTADKKSCSKNKEQKKS